MNAESCQFQHFAPWELVRVDESFIAISLNRTLLFKRTEGNGVPSLCANKRNRQRDRQRSKSECILNGAAGAIFLRLLNHYAASKMSRRAGIWERWRAPPGWLKINRAQHRNTMRRRRKMRPTLMRVRYLTPRVNFSCRSRGHTTAGRESVFIAALERSAGSFGAGRRAAPCHFTAAALKQNWG